MISSLDKNVLEFGFIPGQVVAEFGAGSGHYTLALARSLGDGGRVCAVDISADSLSRLHRHSRDSGLRNVSVICADFETPRGSLLKDASLDGVLLANTLFMLEDKASAVREAQRVLRTDGRLVVVERPESLEREMVEALVSEAGFVLVRTFEPDARHYGLVFKN